MMNSVRCNRAKDEECERHSRWFLAQCVHVQRPEVLGQLHVPIHHHHKEKFTAGINFIPLIKHIHATTIHRPKAPAPRPPKPNNRITKTHSLVKLINEQRNLFVSNQLIVNCPTPHGWPFCVLLMLIVDDTATRSFPMFFFCAHQHFHHQIYVSKVLNGSQLMAIKLTPPTTSKFMIRIT